MDILLRPALYNADIDISSVNKAFIIIIIIRLNQLTDQYNAELSRRDQEIEHMKTRYWPPF